MTQIAIVGSGQAGLIAAHGLLRAGYDVTLYSDRSPEDWLERGRPTGTAVRFGHSLAYEREVGLDDGHLQAPPIEGLKVTVSSGAAKPFLTMNSRFQTAPLAIDLRWQSAAWLRKFTARGGKLVIERVSEARIDQIAAEHTLTIVATGKQGGQLFERDEPRSPRAGPARRLAMVNCVGPSLRFADLPCMAAKFTVFEGLGECYWTPYFHMSERPVWNLVFEARPDTSYDRFQHAESGEEVLSIAKQVVREMTPWDAEWLGSARLADPNSWLVGAITPTVRRPVRRSANGRPIVPLGDAYLSFDPLGAQGANMGNRLAQSFVSAIVRRGDRPFDDEWIRDTYDAFYKRWGGPAMRWTDLLLSPMSAATRYFLLAQQGADGRTYHGTPKQRLADTFAQTFDDPLILVDTLRDFAQTRRFVAGVMGRRADLQAARGLLRVGARRLRNSLAPAASR